MECQQQGDMTSVFQAPARVDGKDQMSTFPLTGVLRHGGVIAFGNAVLQPNL